MEAIRFDYDLYYPVVSSWLNQLGWDDLPDSILPQTGFIIRDPASDRFICVGFLYSTDSTIGILEWVIGNPDIHYELRGKGIELLIHNLLTAAQSLGFTSVFTSTNNDRLLAKYLNAGLTQTDTNMVHGIWRL